MGNAEANASRHRHTRNASSHCVCAHSVTHASLRTSCATLRETAAALATHCASISILPPRGPHMRSGGTSERVERSCSVAALLQRCCSCCVCTYFHAAFSISDRDAVVKKALKFSFRLDSEG